MRKEYDFREKKGVRGKHHKAMQDGYKTIIHKSDRSKVVRITRPIILATDIQEHFPDSEAVNNALCKLIEIVSEK